MVQRQGILSEAMKIPSQPIKSLYRITKILTEDLLSYSYLESMLPIKPPS